MARDTTIIGVPLHPIVNGIKQQHRSLPVHISIATANNLTYPFLLKLSMASLPNTPVGKPIILRAVYVGPTSPDPAQTEAPLHHAIQHELSTSLSSQSGDGVTKKVAYLSELRVAVTSLQAEFNAYLTARMEEDNARTSRLAGKDEAKEEENYGEEVVDEDEN